MKYIHLADTHLGKRRYGRINHETGMNIFEQNVYKNFIDTCEIIATKLKPDFIIHGGDLFDNPRPPMLAMSAAIDGLGIFEDYNIPTYVTSGNHDQNKTIGKGHPFEVLEKSLADTKFIYKGPGEYDEGDMKIYCIPYTLNASDVVTEIEKKSGVLVMHGIEELPSWYMNEFEYVALGHDHHMKKVYDNQWYSGSTEYLTYGELQPVDFNKKGAGKSWGEKEFVKKGIVEVANGKVKPITELPKMGMVQGGRLNCIEKEVGEITEYICEISSKIEQDYQCRITLLNMGNNKKSALDYRLIKEQSSHLLDLTIDVKYVEESMVDLNLETLDKLDIIKEFTKFAEGVSPKVFEFGKELLVNSKTVES